MKVAYIAGPYRSAAGPNGIHENIERARAVAVEVWQRGFMAFCPHLNTAMMDGAVPDSVFLSGGLEMLRRCDIVVLVPGWERSAGSKAEVDLARELGKMVYGLYGFRLAFS